MTTEERLAHLTEHGIGCPPAVKLGGPAAVEAWCEQQELDLEARLAAEDAEAVALADAEAVADAERDARDAERTEAAEAAAAEAEASGETVVTGSDPEPAEDVPEPAPPEDGVLAPIMERLDRLEAAVDALASQGPTVEAVEAVAASPKPKRPKVKKKAGSK